MNRRQTLGLAIAIGALLASSALAAPSKRKPDLGDVAQGSYAGDVISDARGSSHEGVQITVTRTGRNAVRITSDYERLPPFSAKLTRAMSTIQNVGGEEVFLLDLSKRPPSLHVTVDDAAFAGSKDPGDQ